MKKQIILISMLAVATFGFGTGYTLGVNKSEDVTAEVKAVNKKINQAKEFVKKQGHDKAEHLTALYPELSNKELFDLSWDAYILNFDYLDLDGSTPEEYTIEEIADFYVSKWLEYMQEDEAEILDYWINELHINTPTGFVKCCY